jgi:hypothetical protein
MNTLIHKNTHSHTASWTRLVVSGDPLVSQKGGVVIVVSGNASHSRSPLAVRRVLLSILPTYKSLIASGFSAGLTIVPQTAELLVSGHVSSRRLPIFCAMDGKGSLLEVANRVLAPIRM